MIDPDRRTAEFYRLGKTGQDQRVRVAKGVYRSRALPVFWLRVDWLWQQPPPLILDVLRTWQTI